MEPVTAITTGLTIAQGTTTLFKQIKGLFDEGKPEETLSAINQADEKVAELLGTLISIQHSILSTQEENRQLREELAVKEDWEKRLLKFELVETEGRGLVYQHLGNPSYYACPVCVENKKEIQPRQSFQG